MDIGAPNSRRRQTVLWGLLAACLAVIVLPTVVVGLATGSLVGAMVTALGASVFLIVAGRVTVITAARAERRRGK
jgi:hypothetical protein